MPPGNKHPKIQSPDDEPTEPVFLPQGQVPDPSVRNVKPAESSRRTRGNRISSAPVINFSSMTAKDTQEVCVNDAPTAKCSAIMPQVDQGVNIKHPEHAQPPDVIDLMGEDESHSDTSRKQKEAVDGSVIVTVGDVVLPLDSTGIPNSMAKGDSDSRAKDSTGLAHSVRGPSTTRGAATAASVEKVQQPEREAGVTVIRTSAKLIENPTTDEKASDDAARPFHALTTDEKASHDAARPFHALMNVTPESLEPTDWTCEETMPPFTVFADSPKVFQQPLLPSQITDIAYKALQQFHATNSPANSGTSSSKQIIPPILSRISEAIASMVPFHEMLPESPSSSSLSSLEVTPSMDTAQAEDVAATALKATVTTSADVAATKTVPEPSFPKTVTAATISKSIPEMRRIKAEGLMPVWPLEKDLPLAWDWHGSHAPRSHQYRTSTKPFPSSLQLGTVTGSAAMNRMLVRAAVKQLERRKNRLLVTKGRSDHGRNDDTLVSAMPEDVVDREKLLQTKIPQLTPTQFYWGLHHTIQNQWTPKFPKPPRIRSPDNDDGTSGQATGLVSAETRRTVYKRLTHYNNRIREKDHPANDLSLMSPGRVQGQLSSLHKRARALDERWDACRKRLKLVK